ncbi:MAG: serine dehydratase subunit alpha family protein [Ruminococcus sp.]
MKKELYDTYVQILKDELLPAMGCTEPIAIAYAGAIARETLGCIPDRVEIEVSRNIIKNVKSVIVPHTGGLRGIEAAAAIGIIAGNAKRQLEVISSVTEQEIEETRKYLEETALHVDFSKSPLIFDIGITVFHGEEQAYVRIVDYHTNVVTIRHNEQTILSAEITGRTETSMADKSTLTIRDICEFAEIVKIKDVQEVLDRQVSYNMAIATEGIQNSYGANIGRVLLHTYGENDVKIRAKAMAAAGSDARMNGCELPVVINSGSGNQGITVSVPVITYAKELNVSEEDLYRALVVSNLSTLHIKEGIGRLSAYCGAVGAGCGAGAGIAWLHGGRYKEIAHTLVNSLAILSGTICDGAKASCAAKIAAAVDAGILGYFMYKDGQQFIDGDGIVKRDVENTIRCVGLLASEGMQETDKEIVHLMISKEVCQ